MTVSGCRPEDVPELPAAATALFAEDGGRRDPFTDTGRPAREGPGYYAGLVEDPECLCLLAGALDFYRAHGFRPFLVTLTRT